LIWIKRPSQFDNQIDATPPADGPSAVWYVLGCRTSSKPNTADPGRNDRTGSLRRPGDIAAHPRRDLGTSSPPAAGLPQIAKFSPAKSIENFRSREVLRSRYSKP
jgi:hypothetical protein